MPSYFLINSNLRNCPESLDEMLAENIIFAEYEAKEEIDRIEEGDVVFLYQNGVGVIASAETVGGLEIADYEGCADERHWMRVDRFRRVRPPITASEIVEISITESGVRIFWPRTVIPLRPEAGAAIERLANERALR